jgi:hypothetical protein
MPIELLEFFDTYRDAFNTLEAEAIAGLYAVPSGIAQDGVYTHWPYREPIVSNMNAVCELYRKKGYVNAAFEEAAYLAQGETYAIADLRWRIEWNQGQEPWQFNTTYNLVRMEQGWRVLLCTAYTEANILHSTSAAF